MSRKAASLSSQPDDGQSTESSKTPTSISDSFCSQLCLLGIKNGGIPDPSCPNNSMHTVGHLANQGILGCHIIQTIEFYADTHMELIHRSETKSTAIYRMTLPITGFTFILKAAWDQAIPLQRQEYSMYERMEHLQGICVPVCLGALITQFNGLIAPVDTHFLILASAGIPVTAGIVDDSNRHRAPPLYWRIANEIFTSAGVAHNALDWRNVFFNQEINDFMLLDFTRAMARN